jgi:hypothetical protein
MLRFIKYLPVFYRGGKYLRLGNGCELLLSEGICIPYDENYIQLTREGAKRLFREGIVYAVNAHATRYYSITYTHVAKEARSEEHGGILYTKAKNENAIRDVVAAKGFGILPADYPLPIPDYGKVFSGLSSALAKAEDFDFFAGATVNVWEPKNTHQAPVQYQLEMSTVEKYLGGDDLKFLPRDLLEEKERIQALLSSIAREKQKAIATQQAALRERLVKKFGGK